MGSWITALHSGWLKRLLLRILAVIACGALLLEIAHAEDPLGQASAMVSTCSSCHSDDSGSDGSVAPVSLNKLSAEEIEQALLAFRSGKRVGTLMNRLARGYTEAEIAAMAKVLASQ